MPVVHVIAAQRMMDHGLLMRDGQTLERLNEIDHVIFDKTGTLTIGGADGQRVLLSCLTNH